MLGYRAAWRTGLDHGFGFVIHLMEDGIDEFRVVLPKPHIAAAHHFIGNGRTQKSDRRPYPRMRRHDDPLNRQLLRQSARVQWRRATECNQGIVAGCFALFHRVDARRVGHGLINHFGHAVGRHLR